MQSEKPQSPNKTKQKVKSLTNQMCRYTVKDMVLTFFVLFDETASGPVAQTALALTEVQAGIEVSILCRLG